MASKIQLTLLAALLAAGAAQAQPAPPGNGNGNGNRWDRTIPVIASGAWKGPRTADGQPDVQGHWSNTVANHNNFTDPQGGALFAPERADRAGRAPRPREERAPSRVSDPPDGQLPFQDWARAAHIDFAKNFHNPTQPQYIEPLARCAPGGVPKSFMWHGWEIRQFPGYVLFLFDSGARLIHLDGKPQLNDRIKLWNGGSRGHWEGNTLVVEVRNLNGKPLFGRSGEFFSENAQVTERYVFAPDGLRFNYHATVTDPTVYTRPWTATIPARRYTAADKPDGWHYQVTLATHAGKEQIIEREERLCHENNGGFGGVATTPNGAPTRP